MGVKLALSQLHNKASLIIIKVIKSRRGRYGEKVWTGYMWLRIGTSCRFL